MATGTKSVLESGSRFHINASVAAKVFLQFNLFYKYIFNAIFRDADAINCINFQHKTS